MYNSLLDIEETPLSGIRILTPRRFVDDRGFFSESWNAQRMADQGFEISFVQDNHSLSVELGTVRGLHYQAPPHAQTKLVRCGRGRLWDVAVDIRKGSPTFGRWFGTELSFENARQLLIPEGFLHGFVTLEPETEIIYKCSDYYARDCDGVISWNDPDLDIDWPLSRRPPILSDKDARAPAFREFESPFMWEGP